MQLASQPLVTVLIVVVTFFSSACHNCDRVDAFMFSPIAPLSLARRIVRPQANAKREISSPKSRLDASSSPSNDGGLTTQEVARQLIKENTLPSSDDNHEDSSNPFSSYDNEISEFHALMATFLTYSRKDIRSLSSTCNRYLNYKLDLPRESGEDRGIRQTRKRSDEEGIRYRTLYLGVQAASKEPSVLRSFTVLFEDYLPIRIAGRRIYRHLKNVMEEVRQERIGEIERAREVCAGWDWRMTDGKEEQHVIEYSRCIWDQLIDEALLLDDSLQLDGDEHPSETGVVSFRNLFRLGLDQVLIKFDLVKDRNQLEHIINQISLEERAHREVQEPVEIDTGNAITFVEFMRLLYHLTRTSSGSQAGNNEATLTALLQQIQETSTTARQSNEKQDSSVLLAAKVFNSGSSKTCKKRQKHSDQFDHYVKTFQTWESKFLGGDDARMAHQPLRRLEILRGCFEGARNEKVVAALKIVYIGKRNTCLDICFFLLTGSSTEHSFHL